jgi:hypothetical protein
MAYIPSTVRRGLYPTLRSRNIQRVGESIYSVAACAEAIRREQMLRAFDVRTPSVALTPRFGRQRADDPGTIARHHGIAGSTATRGWTWRH